MAGKGLGMTIPKIESTRDKWARCRHCHGTLVACKGLTRDRGVGCCTTCDHTPEEETNGPE